jgi:ribosomal protein L11 methyltransferase
MHQELKEHRCRNLLDVGCGSGALALAGLKLGAESAVGIDLSTRALITSRANAQLNDLEGRLFLVRGSTEAVAGDFDMVVANLPMVVLEDKLEDLARLGGGRGMLILSGFQDVDKHILIKQMDRHHLRARQWLSGDLTFFGVPPSGSFTWMAVLVQSRPS